ncbi:MAG TPA: hypothetical protein VEF04_09245, partial [Blastocatellia bacterium]|nr:hypothetical protein [Blastocatellia bacterium]
MKPANKSPIVSAGPDQLITLPNTAQLAGVMNDDGLPEGAPVTTLWSKVSGPGTVTFGNPNHVVTTASFSQLGVYVLRLTANDSQLSASDDVKITVNQAPQVNAGTDQTARLNINLLQNPGNEAALVNGQISGWTTVSGSWTQAASGLNGFPVSAAGSTYFYAGESTSAELRQDVDVSSFAQLIDTGAQQFLFSGYARSRNESPADSARVIVEYRDGADANVLATYDSGETFSTSDWKPVSDQRIAPTGTRWIRVRLISSRYSGTTNDGYFDTLSLRPVGVTQLRLNGSA